jgi:UDP-N-acetylmuramoyl-L-alanyl-D-glutamate--2,6-diaminopimelate ligase
VVEQEVGAPVPIVQVLDGRRAALVLGRYWYGDPANRLRLVGITGTNGKTTSTALVRHLLNATARAGSIGTLGAFDAQGLAVESTAGSLTTPGPIDLQATLARMLERGVASVVMETSSHSLDQGRLDGLTFAAGCSQPDLRPSGLPWDDGVVSRPSPAGALGPDGVQVVNADDSAWRASRDNRRIPGSGRGPKSARSRWTRRGDRFRPGFGPAGHRPPLAWEFNVANAVAAAAR